MNQNSDTDAKNFKFLGLPEALEGDTNKEKELLSEVSEFIKETSGIADLYQFLNAPVNNYKTELQQENPDYNFTRFIYNGENKEQIILKLKKWMLKIQEFRKRFKFFISRKEQSISEQVQIDMLDDVSLSCQSILDILLIKKATADVDSQRVETLGGDLERTFTNIYGEIKPGEVAELVNLPSIREILEELEGFNPVLWNSIKNRVEPYFRDKPSREFGEVDEYKTLMQAVRDKVDRYLPESFYKIEKTHEYTDIEIKRIFDEILKKIYENPDYSKLEPKWTAIINDKISGFSADQSQLKIPANSSRTGESLIGLIYHEVFVHLIRSVNTQKHSKQGVLRNLPKAVDFEEGLATAVQESAKEKYLVNFGPIERPLIVALIKAGLNTTELRQVLENVFPESVENIPSWLKPYAETRGQKTYLNTEVIVWMHRFLRGTPEVNNDQGQRVIYPKDLAYYRGSVAVNFLVNEFSDSTNKDPVLNSAIQKVFNNILEHSFDALNIQHVKYLVQEKVIDMTSDELKAYLKMVYRYKGWVKK